MCRKRYKVIVVDDHIDFVNQLTEYIQEFEDVTLVASYTSSMEAAAAIALYDEIDFLFLDIEMPQLDGIVLAQKVREKVKNLVFVSAHSRYAVDAFKVSANGFLSKPLSFKKFEEYFVPQIAKLNELFQEQEDFLMVREKIGESNLVKLCVNTIVMAELNKDFMVLHTEDNLYYSNFSALSFEDLVVSKYDFLKTGDRLLICANYVLTQNQDSVLMSNGHTARLTESELGKLNLINPLLRYSTSL